MNRLFWIPALVVAWASPAGAQPRTPPPLPAPIQADRGVEVQTRGPVHEAFLEPADTQAQPHVVPQPPPAEVPEAPPQERPVGGVVWVGGYWAWEDDRHVWVSGCWRVPPPGHHWLPGRWQQARVGSQWVPGAWLSADLERVELLPTPPAPQPEAPPTLAEGEVFVPGTWTFRDGRYAWRPGFPLALPSGWVWTNARYVTTPAGALFVEGHWDLPVQERGLLFAPVSFAARPAEYVPRYVVGADALLGSLFVNTRTHHYYYGDYAGRYVAWDEYRVRGIGGDPLYGYYKKHGGRPKDKAVAVVPLDQYLGAALRRVGADEGAFYQLVTRGYADAAQTFARYEQEVITRGRPLPTAPVVVPVPSWKGHPHGMPPGQAKKYQVPGFPDGKGKGQGKGKGKGKGGKP